MYNSLQAGRAVAAALVVLFHLGGSFAQDKYFGFKAIDAPFAWGDAGVDFFFVLSGFLITTVHRRDFGRPQALGDYLFKRAARIYPTYWLVCALVCIGALAVPSFRQSLPVDALTWLKTLALLPQDPAVVGGTGAPILFVAWSLQYEVLFYAIVAIVIVSIPAGLACIGALLLVQTFCQIGNACAFPGSFIASPMVLLFAMGAACAFIVPGRFRMPLPLLVAGLAIVAFVGFGLYEVNGAAAGFGESVRLVYGALSSLIIVSLAQAEDAGSLALNGRAVALLGDSSYALYLLHIPVISLACKILLQLKVSGAPVLIACFIATFLLCIGSGLVFHLLIERRLLRWIRVARDRWLRRTPASTARRGVSVP